jgi:hypothetical protein
MAKSRDNQALVHPKDRLTPKAANRPYTTVKNRAPYDPEAEFTEPTLSAHDFHRRTAIESKAIERGDVQIRGRIAVVRAYKDGKMAEAKPAGAGSQRGWGLGFSTTKESDRHVAKTGTKYYVDFVRVETLEQFKRLTAKPEWATAKLLETFGVDAFDFGFEDSVGAGSVVGPPNNEYTPLLGGPFSKQLYLYDYLDMHAKCFWAKNHHPFGKAIVNTLRAYIIGKGVKLLFKNPDCQRAWDEFEKRVDFQDKLRTDVETLIWAGEIMTEKRMDSEGRPTISQIDPSTVWEIVTDPLTPEIPIYFHQQFPTQWQLTYKASDKSSEYVINDIDGSKVIHMKINTAPGEKRGRSDLFAVLSWLKRFRDYFNAKVVKAQMEESWALDIAVDGSQADIESISANNDVTRVPPAGSVRVHNKNIEYTYLQPTSSSAQGRDNVGEQLKNVIAIGAGIAPEWLGESAAGSTAETARTKEGPASRNIEDKQMVAERYIRKVAEFVMEADATIPETQIRVASLGNLKQALLKRDWKALLKETTAILTGGVAAEPTDKHFEIIFPEAAGEDRAAKLDAILQGEAARFISHERASTMYAKEMNITDYDASEEAAEIQAEADMGGGNPEWANAARGNQPGKQGQNQAAAEDDEDREDDEEPEAKGKKTAPGKPARK